MRGRARRDSGGQWPEPGLSGAAHRWRGVLPDGKTTRQRATGAEGRRGVGAPSRGQGRCSKRVTPSLSRRRAACGGVSRAARQRREVTSRSSRSHSIDKDRLLLVILSSGVQEGRPFFLFRGISAQIFHGSGNSTRRRGEAFPRLVTRDSEVLPATDDTRAAAGAAAFSDSDDGTTKKPDGRTFALAFNDLLIGEPERIFGDASGVVRSARAARPPRRASWSGLLPRPFRGGARTRFARRRRPPRAATCATSRPWRSFLARGRERRKNCRAPMRNDLLFPHNPVTLSRKSIL